MIGDRGSSGCDSDAESFCKALEEHRVGLRDIFGEMAARIERLRLEQTTHEERLLEMLARHALPDNGNSMADVNRLVSLQTQHLPGEPMQTDGADCNAADGTDAPVATLAAWIESKETETQACEKDGKKTDVISEPSEKEGPSSPTSPRRQRSMVSVYSQDGNSNDLKNRLRRVLQHPACRALCSFVILLNAVTMGVHSEHQLCSLVYEKQEAGPEWEIVEKFFCVFFTLELLFRVYAERRRFLVSDEAPWNIFDAVLVVFSLVDWLLGTFSAGGGVNLTFVRTIRILRFARIFRIIRVMRFFHSFRIMVYSILYSFVSLLWVFMLLFFIMYCFSSFFLYGVTEHFRKKAHDNSDYGDELSVDLILYYGSVPKAIRTLFMSISGGMDWIDLMSPLEELNGFYGIVFVFYVFFMCFGVLNVVIGIFVDSSSEISQNNREIVTRNEMDKNKSYAEHLRRFFHEADADDTGTLSWEEFEDYLQDKKVQAYFRSFELDVSQARQLFQLLDMDGSNDVAIDEFVQGCMRLKGQARSIDVNMLLFETEKIFKQLENFMEFCSGKFGEIEKEFKSRNK